VTGEAGGSLRSLEPSRAARATQHEAAGALVRSPKRGRAPNRYGAAVPRYVQVSGRRVAYDTWGDPAGLAVFQLHGTPGTRLQRYPDNARLAQT